MRERTAKLSQAKWIKLEIKDLTVELQPDGTANVRFKQNYESNSFKDSTEKTLGLAADGADWKIVSER